MKFYHFAQRINCWSAKYESPAQHVVVEAENHDDANLRAEVVGVYFDGFSSETKECVCGECVHVDRWYRRLFTDSGDDVPMVYGEPVVFEFDSVKEEPYVLVVYADGTQKMGVEKWWVEFWSGSVEI